MTRDEVGTPFLTAIQHIGRVLGAQQRYACIVHSGSKDEIASSLNELNELRCGIPPLLDKLDDHDAAEIVRRYPWVLQL